MAKLAEWRKSEVLRIPLPRTPVNKGKHRAPGLPEAPPLCFVKCPIAAILSIGVVTASCGATYVYIVVNRLGASIRVSSATATLPLVASAAPDKWVVNGYPARYETTNLRASFE
jgi:hypothetical protein